MKPSIMEIISFVIGEVSAPKTLLEMFFPELRRTQIFSMSLLITR
jgi:hypothetical protein